MGRNNPRTKFLSNKKQKARKLGIDVSGIKISNKLTDNELKALDKKLNALIKAVNPNYNPKVNPVFTPQTKPRKPRREKRPDSASNLLKQLKQAQDDYIKSIPTEMMEQRHFKEYFLNGRHLIDVEHPYGLDTIGFKMKNFNSVKEAKEFYGTKSQKKLEQLLKNEIKQTEYNNYENQVNLRKDMIEEIINAREEQGQSLSVLERNSVNQRLEDMNLPELINFINLLENNHNVYDSIFNSYSEDDTDAYEKTVDVLLKISKKKKHLSWY